MAPCALHLVVWLDWIGRRTCAWQSEQQWTRMHSHMHPHGCAVAPAVHIVPRADLQHSAY